MATTGNENREFHELVEQVLGKTIILLSAVGLVWLLRKLQVDGDLRKRMEDFIAKTQTGKP